jgi:hypothetical protein
VTGRWCAICSCRTTSGVRRPVTRAVSVHGWWTRTQGNATLADVRVDLQAYAGTWRTVASNTVRQASGTGGSNARTTTRLVCKNDSSWNTFRSVVDVDVVGYIDGRAKYISPHKFFRCGL